MHHGILSTLISDQKRSNVGLGTNRNTSWSKRGGAFKGQDQLNFFDNRTGIGVIAQGCEEPGETPTSGESMSTASGYGAFLAVKRSES